MDAAVLPYRAMAYNNAWANQRLLNACAKLSQAEFIAPRTGFFPSIRATLNHILVVDRFYVDAMEGGTLGPAAWANPEPCETVAVLHAAQSEVDRRLIAFIEPLRKWVMVLAFEVLNRIHTLWRFSASRMLAS